MDASLTELEKYRLRDAKRKQAQRKYRQLLKTRTPPPSKETAEELAEKKRVADEKKKLYMSEYTKKRISAIKHSKSVIASKLANIADTYRSGELAKLDREQLIDMIIGLHKTISENKL